MFYLIACFFALDILQEKKSRSMSHIATLDIVSPTTSKGLFTMFFSTTSQIVCLVYEKVFVNCKYWSLWYFQMVISAECSFVIYITYSLSLIHTTYQRYYQITFHLLQVNHTCWFAYVVKILKEITLLTKNIEQSRLECRSRLSRLILFLVIRFHRLFLSIFQFYFFKKSLLSVFVSDISAHYVFL